jgi:hypothetical protein
VRVQAAAANSCLACLLQQSRHWHLCAARFKTMPPNIPSYSQGKAPAANCWQCRHFATSWDPALPYSCKLLGFKSRMLPCMQVQQLDGRACQGFDRKPVAAQTGAKVSANRQ